MNTKHPRASHYEAPQIEQIAITVEQGFAATGKTDGYVEDDGTW